MGSTMRKKYLWAYTDSKGPGQTAQIDCTFVQSDQGLSSPLTESLYTTECMNGEKRPRQYFAHAQDDLNLRIFFVLDGTFLLDVAHIR